MARLTRARFVHLPNDVNKSYVDGPAAFDPFNKQLYFTGKNKKMKGIMVAEAEAFYRDPVSLKPFQYNSKAFSVAYPALSFDGERLYFASDMPGGMGGWDLYMCERAEDGQSWNAPQNLGPQINTPGNEKYPFISRTDWIYYASDGHPNGFGGLDLFRNKENGPAEHLPYPVNTKFDDYAFSTDAWVDMADRKRQFKALYREQSPGRRRNHRRAFPRFPTRRPPDFYGHPRPQTQIRAGRRHQSPGQGSLWQRNRAMDGQGGKFQLFHAYGPHV